MLTTISALMKKITQVHSAFTDAIEKGGDDACFFGYDFDDSNTGDRDSLLFPRLGLGTKISGHANGAFTLNGGSIGLNLSIEIVLLDICAEEEGNDKQYPVERMQNVAKDIISFLNFVATTDTRYTFLANLLRNNQTLPVSEVGPITQSKAYGVQISIPYHQAITFKESNPLWDFAQEGFPEP